MAANSTTDIFSGVTFTVIPSDDVDAIDPDDRSIRDAMIQRGADFVPLGEHNEVRQLEKLSHIIATNVDFPEYAKAIDININVVKPTWVAHSITKKKATNPRQYSPDPSQFLHDVVISTGTLPLGDKDSIEAACLAMGGLYSGPLQKMVTHLITTDDNHEKAQIVKQRELKIKIVLPHWIDDCIKLGKKIGEGPYTFPDPEILRRERLSMPRASPSPFIDGATSATPDGLPEYKIPSPSASRQNLNAFMSKKIMLSRDLTLGDRHLSNIRSLINHGGGLLTSDLNEADIYIGHFRDGVDYITASRNNKSVANLSWLYYVINQNRWTDPTRKLLFYPIPRKGIPGFEHMIISISNYTGSARTYLENLINACGATFTKTMKMENTHLITAHKSSEKCDAAQEWNINIVNHLWLEESYAKCCVQSLTNPKYTHFPLRTNLGEVVGQANLDMKRVESEYFSQSRFGSVELPKSIPIHVSPRKVVSSMPPGSGLMDSDLPSKSVGFHAPEQDGMSKPEERLPEPASIKKRGRPPKTSLETPSRPVTDDKENESPAPPGTGRASKNKALSSLHAQAADIELYQKEMKRKGGVIHGRERRSSHLAEDTEASTPAPPRQGRKRKSEEAAHDVTAEGSDLSDGETQEQPRPTKKGKKGGDMPPIQYKMMVTGDPRWHDKPSKETTDKAKLRALGIQVVAEPKGIDILVAPRILRTKKFVAAIAFAPLIVDPKYLDFALKKNAIPDKPQLLEDSQGEAEYGFRLTEAVARAEVNKRRLLRGWTIFVTRDITGGFDTYKDIVTLNGGTAVLYQGRTGVKIPLRRLVPEQDPDARGESQHQGGEEECDYVYLVSGDSDAEAKLWKAFRAMCEKQDLKTRIVKSDWLLNACMRQEIKYENKWEWEEENS